MDELEARPYTDVLSLTREELDALPENTPITVMWSGGNGPHKYILVDGAFGLRYACLEKDLGDPRLREINPLEFVGTERRHTRVWLTGAARETTTSYGDWRALAGEEPSNALD